MAAGKNGWKCGAVLKMTLICFFCMTLFHSGNAQGQNYCQDLELALSDDHMKYGEEIGKHLANSTVKQKNGQPCEEGSQPADFNPGCKVTINYDEVNAGIKKAGGGAACESMTCEVPVGKYVPICKQQGSPPNPKPGPGSSPKPSPSGKSTASKQLSTRSWNYSARPWFPCS